MPALAPQAAHPSASARSAVSRSWPGSVARASPSVRWVLASDRPAGPGKPTAEATSSWRLSKKTTANSVCLYWDLKLSSKAAIIIEGSKFELKRNHPDSVTPFLFSRCRFQTAHSGLSLEPSCC